VNNYIEGTFSWNCDGFPILRINNDSIPLMDGREIRLNTGEDWISGVHIYGDILCNGRKNTLQPGDKIQIKSRSYMNIL
jgi:hypothetical protein